MVNITVFGVSARTQFCETHFACIVLSFKNSPNCFRRRRCSLETTNVGNRTDPCHRIPDAGEGIPYGAKGMVLRNSYRWSIIPLVPWPTSHGARGMVFCRHA
ncbi:unnamed protein product [Ectocarpus sp. 12 AP-2014]